MAKRAKIKDKISGLSLTLSFVAFVVLILVVYGLMNLFGWFFNSNPTPPVLWDEAKVVVNKLYVDLESQNYQNVTNETQVITYLKLLDSTYGKVKNYKIEGFDKYTGVIPSKQEATVFLTVYRENFTANETIIVQKTSGQSQFSIVEYYPDYPINKMQNLINP